MSHATVKSPPCSTVVLSNTPTAPVCSSSVKPEQPIPTNYENIDDLYLDKPVTGPSSHPLVPSAPLLSQQGVVEPHTTHSQMSFSNPLRRLRKRKRIHFFTPKEGLEESLPSSPSPVKVSLGMANAPCTRGRLNIQSKVQECVLTTPVPKRTRAQSAKAHGKQPVGKDPSKAPPTNERSKTTTRTHIPTPSSTPPIHRQSIAEPSSPSAMSTPSPPKQCSARQAAAVEHPMDPSSKGEDVGQIKMWLRFARLSVDPRSKPIPHA